MVQLRKVEISLDTWRAIEAARMSFAESHDEIIARAFCGRRARPARDPARMDVAKAGRRRGKVTLGIFGRVQPVANLKAGYVAALGALVRHKPSLFELLAHEGGPRRRWIARNADDLYPGSPHLAADFAFPILPGWYLDTNVSRVQIARRLEVACTLSGYRLGKDIVLEEG